GFDFPTEAQFHQSPERCNHPPIFDGGVGSCLQPWVYPNHRDDPRIDMIFTHAIPREFLDEGRLPDRFNLEDLIGRLLTWRDHLPPVQNRNPGSALERFRETLRQMESFLSPGSSLTLQVEELRDLFLPGVLDLSGARGNLEIRHLGSG